MKSEALIIKKRLKHEWMSNVNKDIMSGVVVALALIPEAIGFSIVAGVDPMVGIYGAVCMAIVTAILGGRMGMISAATGAMALVLAGLFKAYGIEYMLLATILAGIIQIILGIIKVDSLMKFIPHPVMIGFVNALGILIFMAQMPSFKGENWTMYAMVVGGLVVIYLLPRITKAVPSSLVAIVVISAIAIFTGSGVRTVGDMGTITNKLPSLLFPNVILSLSTLKIILPYSISLAFVGLIETLLTAEIVDGMTQTRSNKMRECMAQGIGNIVVGLFGGLAACAMIGQSVINVKSGGRTRLSSLTAGVFLMFLIIVLNGFVVKIPLAALVAVMIMVSISTFDWNSIKTISRVPKLDTVVMLVTVATVIYTHNLAIGVFVGVVLSCMFFVSNIAKIKIEYTIDKENSESVYKVHGQLFFASAKYFVNAFKYDKNKKIVNIDFSNSHIWDHSAVNAIDKVVLKYHKMGIKVFIVGANTDSMSIIDQVAMFNKPGGLDREIGH
ncbi:MAG: SulP family inorganic anion transporter [Clostridium sp.]|uniref:SulP family inorganic anion transporter n=1 Tax=Clostridium sp. TaxID=1506 RepID=UPI003D6CD3D1